MGIAVIGGLLTSLFLTLVVVPAAYDLFDDMQQKKGWKGLSRVFQYLRIKGKGTEKKERTHEDDDGRLPSGGG